MAMLDTMSISGPRHLSEKRIVIYDEKYTERPRRAEFAMHTSKYDVSILCQFVDDTVLPRRVSEFTIDRCVQYDELAHPVVHTYEPSTIWKILETKDPTRHLNFFKETFKNFEFYYEMDIIPDLQLSGKK